MIMIHTKKIQIKYLPLPHILQRSSINIWSSLTVRRSPLTITFHSACAFPLNITRMAMYVCDCVHNAETRIIKKIIIIKIDFWCSIDQSRQKNIFFFKKKKTNLLI